MKNILLKLFLAAICILGISACGDSTSNKTTIIKKETKIDGDGHERTKIETKTVEIKEKSSDGTVVHERVIEEKDPIVKLGPIEIRKN